MPLETREKKKNGVFQDIDRLNAPLDVFLHRETQTGGSVGPHWHYYLEILFLLKGTLEAVCDDTVYTMYPGDLILFYPQAVHAMHRSPEAKSDTEEILYFVLMADLNFLNTDNRYHTRFSKMFRMAYTQDPSYVYFSKKELEALPVLQLLSHSLKEMQNKTYGYDILVSSDISTLLTYLVRCLREKGLDTDTIITTPDESDTSIYSITQYIEQHCGEALKVQDLAGMCGMSYPYFAKLFRETYNQSCKEYIEFSRINKVEELLLFTDLDLNYISQETGFSDCSHLIRSFKQRKGMTPKQWRREMKV